MQQETQGPADRSRSTADAGLVVVAVGGSAGGLEPLRAFFGAVVPDGRLAYVVITHLPVQHQSHLAHLLDRAGTLRVGDLRDGERIEGGKGYVAPPGVLLGIAGGVAVVRTEPAGTPHVKAIDHFMNELADDFGERAIGVVLSGADHDGTAGLKAIKAAGGLAIAQEPSSAQFPSMPASAVGAATVDMVLAPASMPAAIGSYLDRTADGSGRRLAETDGEHADRLLQEVLSVVWSRTGHDFKWYRPAMLQRRLRRRMALRQVDSVADYLALITQSVEEVEALKREFLIGVTDFFRDPAAWDALANETVPALLANRRGDEQPVRVWTPGCASGEESYSIAMLLIERMEAAGLPPRVQVFGTDIDTDALGFARQGSYPDSIAATVSVERLARFFDRRGDRYVVRKQLRDAVVFAPHNLVRDAPFSRLDLVLCRNLLIYFQTELQDRVLDVLHFALKPGGFLALGKSESASSRDFLFEPTSRGARIFRRIGRRAHLPRGFPFAASGPAQWWGVTHPTVERVPAHAELVASHLRGRDVDCAVLVDREARALYFHGNSSAFFEPRGDATFDFVFILKAELRLAARHVVRHALSERVPSAQDAVIAHEGATRTVRLSAEPIEAFPGSGLLVVVFQLAPVRPRDAGEAAVPAPADEGRGRPPDEGRRHFALALEEAERSNQELRLANEEISTLNEELQSSNEELESSREELQSVNEELETVNSELEEKLAEIARHHDDLANLLSSTDIATILMDAGLRIRQFTPGAMKVFALQPGDEGRLLTDIATRVEDPRFTQELAHTLRSGERTEVEVRTREGTVFLRRVLPFLTGGGKAEGVVVTFVDITPLRASAQAARHLLVALQDSNDAVIAFNPAGAILSWNAGAVRAYGYSEEEAAAAGLFGLVPASQRQREMEMIHVALREGRAGPLDAQRRARHGAVVNVSITVTALRDDAGHVYALMSTERDLTERLNQEKEIHFRRLADNIPALLRVEDATGRALFANSAFAEFTGRSREALLGEGWLQYLHPADRGAYGAAHAGALSQRARFEIDFRMLRKDGEYRWMRSISVPHYGADEAYGGYVVLMLDIEDRKQAELALQEADRRKDDFLAMLAHELRNPLAPISNAVTLLETPQVNPQDAAWATGIIGRQTEALSRLLDDLLDVARIARGKVNLSVAPISLRVLVDRAVEVSRPLIDSRRHRLTVHQPVPALTVEGDLVRLTQVLSNLLNNAAKYTDEGGTIDLRAQEEGHEVAIRVSDNGAGISPAMLPRVFELFAQADVTLDRAKGGLGLGLTLARQLVEMHGGTIEAHSGGLGRGSEFVVRLPVSRAERRDKDPEPLQDTPGARRRILLVDDNVDAASMLEKLLQMQGHEVRMAHDAQQALAIARDLKPHAAVLDIGLPGMDGYQLARRLRGQPLTAKILLVAVTGYGQPDDLVKARAAGFDHHLVKPVSPQQLHQLVQQTAHDKT